MKKTIRVLSLASLALVSSAIYYTSSTESVYTPREVETSAESNTIAGAFEYLHSLKANQISKDYTTEDIRNVQQQIRDARALNKTTFPLNWENNGPDNIGGRTRAILIDNQDNSILYTGGVSGGLFKSTNGGSSWLPVDDKMENMNIGSICQTSNGDLYVGTGESFASTAGSEFGTPGFPGDGIYKSTDGGVTIEKIASSGIFTYVNEMAVRPGTNDIYAATNLGLYYSTDAGDSWTRIRPGNARDFKFDKNGNILAYVANQVVHSTNPTDNNSYVRSEGLSNGVRVAVAYSNSDPNYAYVIVAGAVTFEGPNGEISVSDGLVGVFQSKDNGKTFNKIIGKTSLFFSPLTHVNLGSGQGTYNLCIAVDPNNKERIFMGGIEFAEWSEAEGPKIVGNTFGHPSNPVGIHSDKHVITFDLKANPPIMYIGCDGGVYKTTNAALNNYTPINRGFQTTQFYGISAGTNGIVMGGTQDNNTIVIDGNGSSPEAGEAILGGDGFKCAISQENPDVLFAQSQFGRLVRSLNAGGSVASIFDERILSQMVDGDEPGITPSNIFNSPLKLWEDANSDANRLFYALDGEVWMADDAVNSPNPHFYKLADLSGSPHVFEVTPEGNSMYAAGFGGSRIYRIDGLNKANFDTSELTTAQISDSIQLVDIKSNLPGGRNITDIEVDVNNPNRVIVTLGNYNNSAYVYITENAMDAAPTWRSIQGALPRFPVYDAEISIENPDEIILGTEFGVWATSNGSATNPLWQESGEGMPNVPVFEMVQVEAKKSSNWRTGPVLYAGTHGRGIFRSNNLLTSVRPVSSNLSEIQISAFPNPSSSSLEIKASIQSPQILNFSVYSLDGRLMIQESQEGIPGQSIKINTDALGIGTYIIIVEGEDIKGNTKWVKTR